MNRNTAILLIYCVFCFASCNSGNGKNGVVNKPAGDGRIAAISFSEYEHDFGKISEGEKVSHIFTFENKGPGDLVINSATTTCGCTVTKYDKKPIPAGQGGSLEVVFDSRGWNGKQTKTISVHSNSELKVVILKITAEVVSKN